MKIRVTTETKETTQEMDMQTFIESVRHLVENWCDRINKEYSFDLGFISFDAESILQFHNYSIAEIAKKYGKHKDFAALEQIKEDLQKIESTLDPKFLVNQNVDEKPIDTSLALSIYEDNKNLLRQNIQLKNKLAIEKQSSDTTLEQTQAKYTDLKARITTTFENSIEIIKNAEQALDKMGEFIYGTEFAQPDQPNFLGPLFGLPLMNPQLSATKKLHEVSQESFKTLREILQACLGNIKTL